MVSKLITPRLLVDPLTKDDSGFIFKLVNTAEWIEFIGNRNVVTLKDASDYIQKILYGPNSYCWVARLRDNQIPIGIITFLKHEYVQHFDLGFAFLPDFTGQGYAFEASAAVLQEIKADPMHSQILGITLANNKRSIRLLEKLGMKFSEEIKVGQEQLMVYAIQLEG